MLTFTVKAAVPSASHVSPCLLTVSHLKAANVDIHMTPQNALLGVTVVSGQQSKAMESEEQGVTPHWRMSQSSSQLTAWRSDELLGLGCCELKHKGFPAGLYSAFKKRQNSLSSCYSPPHCLLSLYSLCLPLTKIKSSLKLEFWCFMEKFFTDQCWGDLSISQQHGMWQRARVTTATEARSCQQGQNCPPAWSKNGRGSQQKA